ncbi:MAG: hypothetical protein A2015_08260 [Spirochaetes bacterium GWF1_31_7]|nr:MAG: hypothetical protein A2Y30_08455 [Spirochaetes bacterium GWE1_32_154]OHD47141.1 MAG: hypothetical protein A2015_08260 [Spirochaetes bacterium GWF1_31_7]HBD94936.1 hypothetical protein [Spirochaetia bacterium]HBI36079.1 hypothetical protein [Spirochaetia bacterium]
MERISLIKAVKEDAEALKTSQVKAFLDDNKNKPDGVTMDMPPGCNSLEWNIDVIEKNEVYKIMYDTIPVGGFIIFSGKENCKIIGRVWILPEYQNRGIGKKAFDILFKMSKIKTSWYLETPDWAFRNHHFYESIGFVKTGETEFDNYCGWKEYKYQVFR